MELVSPSCRTFSVKAQDVNWLPWSEWMIVDVDDRDERALATASLTNAVSQRRSMAQPTTLRE
jgi:hypothetical protein